MSAIITPKVADPSEGVVKALKEEVGWALSSLMASAKPQEYDALQTRAMTYPAKLDPHTYTCPHCWMRRHVASPLFPRNGTDDYDLLGCQTCGNDVIIPF